MRILVWISNGPWCKFLAFYVDLQGETASTNAIYGMKINSLFRFLTKAESFRTLKSIPRTFQSVVAYQQISFKLKRHTKRHCKPIQLILTRKASSARNLCRRDRCVELVCLFRFLCARFGGGQQTSSFSFSFNCCFKAFLHRKISLKRRKCVKSWEVPSLFRIQIGACEVVSEDCQKPRAKYARSIVQVEYLWVTFLHMITLS